MAAIHGPQDGALSGARDGVAISYGGGDQTSTRGASRGVYISTAGTLVVRLQASAADLTFAGLLAGTIYPLQIMVIRQSGSTAGGVLLY